MYKKDDLPWMKWFWGDWFKCPEIRALRPETRCAWFEMLGLMWESTERGYLTLNGNPYPMDCLARCLGFAQANLEQSIAEMELFNVFSRREDGAIYNRRMISDCELGEKRAIAGKRGGICSSKTRSKIQANNQASTDSDSDSDSDLCIKDKSIIYSSEGIPGWLKNDWSEWEQHRRQIKKKLTPLTIKKQLEKLLEMGPDRAKAAIQHSIQNGWTGIFEKGGFDGKGNSGNKTGARFIGEFEKGLEGKYDGI